MGRVFKKNGCECLLGLSLALALVPFLPVRAASISAMSAGIGGMNTEGQLYINSRLPGLMPYYGPSYSCGPVGQSAPTYTSTAAAGSVGLGNQSAPEIWEQEPGFPGLVPNLQSIQLVDTYYNATGAPETVQIWADVDDDQKTYVNGVEIFSGGYDQVEYKVVTLNAGVNNISATALNDDPGYSGPNPAFYAFMMEDMSGNVLLTSSTQWQVVIGSHTTYVQQCQDSAPGSNGTSGTTEANAISQNWSGPTVGLSAYNTEWYMQNGWDATFPDPNASMICPSEGASCGNFPAGYVADYGFVYQNTTGANITATLTGIFDDMGVVSIDGQVVMSASGSGTTTVTIPPGLNQIVIQNTNQYNQGGVANPIGSALTAISSTGQVLFNTSPSWILLGTYNPN